MSMDNTAVIVFPLPGARGCTDTPSPKDPIPIKDIRPVADDTKLQREEEATVDRPKEEKKKEPKGVLLESSSSSLNPPATGWAPIEASRGIGGHDDPPPMATPSSKGSDPSIKDDLKGDGDDATDRTPGRHLGHPWLGAPRDGTPKGWVGSPRDGGARCDDYSLRALSPEEEARNARSAGGGGYPLSSSSSVALSAAEADVGGGLVTAAGLTTRGSGLAAHPNPTSLQGSWGRGIVPGSTVAGRYLLLERQGYLRAPLPASVHLLHPHPSLGFEKTIPSPRGDPTRVGIGPDDQTSTDGTGGGALKPAGEQPVGSALVLKVGYYIGGMPYHVP